MILYKYCPPNNRTLNILRNRKVWFSKPKYFNDPFDGFIQLPEVSEELRYQRLLHGHLRIGNPQGDPEFADNLQTAVESSGQSSVFTKLFSHEEYRVVERDVRKRGVLSLSKTKNSLLMWSHYAQRHEGVCIAFEIDRDSIPDSLYLIEVDYVGKERPLIDRNHLGTVEQRICKILGAKYQDWNYEYEWRFITKQEIGDYLKGVLLDVPGTIVGVTAGMNCQKRFLELLRRRASMLGLRNLDIMTPSYFQYSLTPRSII